MLDEILDFSPGVLLFQCYLYTYHISPYEDEYRTRAPVLDSLALLTFMFTAIAIYKCYSPCHEAWKRGGHMYGITSAIGKFKKQHHEMPKTTHDQHSKVQATDRDVLSCITNDHRKSQILTEDTYHPKAYCECDAYCFERTDILINLNGQATENSPTESTCKRDSDDHDTAWHKDANYTLEQYSLYDVSTVIQLLIDFCVIYCGVHHLLVFCKYYLLYYWALVSVLDLVQLILIPVIVLVVEITASLARTLVYILRLTNETKASKQEVEAPAYCKHVVVFQV